ncbi:hypothetical protein D3C80_1926030 [compost metagenome]
MKKSESFIIGIAIIIGFSVLGLFLMTALGMDGNNNEYRYEFVPANEHNIIIFDKQTGEYWNKFIPSDAGPTNWESGNSPIKSDK